MTIWDTNMCNVRSNNDFTLIIYYMRTYFQQFLLFQDYIGSNL